MVNSNRGRHLTVGELPQRSSHTRGHLRLCAGMEKLLRVVSVCLDHVIKTGTPSSSLFLLPLFSPVATAQFRRVRAIVIAPSQSWQSIPQLRLLLANPADLSLTLDFTGKRCALPFFLAADSFAVECASPWPALYGASLLLLSIVPASPCCHDALCLVD